MAFTVHPALAASVLAVLALQCGGSTPPGNSPESSSSSVEGAAAASSEAPENGGARPKSNLTDAQIAKVTDSVHAGEIEQARLAQQKTENEQVRQFASMMIDQHSRARQQASRLNIGSEESELSRSLQTHSTATVEQLKTKQGPDFDRAYLEAQVDAHQQVLDTIHNDLRPNAQSPELQAYLRELEPQVAQHLDHARQAEHALESGAPDTRGAGTTTGSGR